MSEVRGMGGEYFLKKKISLGTIYLRRRQIFTNFDPYPRTVGSFLVQSVGKFALQFLKPYFYQGEFALSHFFRNQLTYFMWGTYIKLLDFLNQQPYVLIFLLCTPW